MEVSQKVKRIRIYIGEADRFEHKPLYEAIVLEAKKFGVAGATVFRAPMGFGKTSELHTAKILQLSMDLPFIIELVDEEAKLRSFLEVLEPMMAGGLITMEDVEILHHQGVDKK
ncbi:MAG: DUF190 domain-containing protein [Chthoniobacterales bacterium]